MIHCPWFGWLVGFPTAFLCCCWEMMVGGRGLVLEGVRRWFGKVNSENMTQVCRVREGLTMTKDMSESSQSLFALFSERKRTKLRPIMRTFIRRDYATVSTQQSHILILITNRSIGMLPFVTIALINYIGYV